MKRLNKETLFAMVNDTVKIRSHKDYWDAIPKVVGKEGIQAMKEIILESKYPFSNLYLEEDVSIIYNFMRLMVLEYTLTDSYTYIPSLLEQL